jgi:Zn-dependent oligopeptidase
MNAFIEKYNLLQRQLADASVTAASDSDATIRESATQTKSEISKKLVDIFSVEEYNTFKWEYELAHKLMLKFRNNGCGNTQVMDINKQISEAEVQFNKNIADQVYKIHMPDSDEPVILSPNLYNKILTTSDNEELRRRAVEIYDVVIPGNMSILERLYELRGRKAQLLGYESVSDMVHAQMSVKNAQEFLTDLMCKLIPLVSRDLQDKSRVLGVSIADLRAAHNRRYYNSKYFEAVYGVSLSEPRYELTTVIRVIRELYSEILGIEISIDENARDGMPAFVVNGDRRIYLDLHHREGKYPHPSEWPVFRSSQRAEAVMMCCVDDKISHSALESIFHELGHCLNVVLNAVPLQEVGGTNTVRDIVEVPSMYFEHAIWNPHNIARFGVDRETATALAKCHYSLVAEQMYLNTAYGLLDIRLNNGEISPVDAARVMTELTHFEFDHGNFITRWVHQAGYECVYYAYTYAACWSAQLCEYPERVIEYLQYSSAENLERLFGPLNIDKYVRLLA